VPERLPFQQFHGDEGSPIGLVDLVNGADVCMVQGGRSLGLPLETAEGLCILGEFVGKQLQGDVATELEVFRLVHNTNAPAPNLAQDAVMGNCLTHGLGGRGHWLDMLGADDGKVNVRWHFSSGQMNHNRHIGISNSISSRLSRHTSREFLGNRRDSILRKSENAYQRVSCRNFEKFFLAGPCKFIGAGNLQIARALKPFSFQQKA
jgi:hypothetical protein